MPGIAPTNEQCTRYICLVTIEKLANIDDHNDDDNGDGLIINAKNSHRKLRKGCSANGIMQTPSSARYEEYYFDFRNGDYEQMNYYLSYIDWDTLLENKSVDDAVVLFYEHVFGGIEMFIPLKRYRNSSFPSWFNSDLRKMLKEKKMAHRKYKESMDEDDYNVFSSLRASCNRLRNCCYQKYICKVEDSISGSPYAFWKFINDKRNLSNIPSSMNYGDTTSNDNSTTVDLFADYFSTVYNNINVNQTPTYAFSSNVNIVLLLSKSLLRTETKIKQVLKKHKSEFVLEEDFRNYFLTKSNR
nr:unnamed protein product [Callosobruchus chinensis]